MGGHYKILLRYILEIGLNSRKDVMITKETKPNGREVISDLTSQQLHNNLAESRRPSGIETLCFSADFFLNQVEFVIKCAYVGCMRK